jgi:uncharacterized protein
MAPFALRISNDKLKAYLTLTPSSADTMDIGSIAEQLKTSGIAADINEAAIKDAVERKAWNESILIAQGREPQRGTDGTVEYYFDIHPKSTPKINADGSVDYRNLNISQSVTAGQELARLIMPQVGIDGVDVFGKVIPAPKGKFAKLSKGKNTSYANPENTVIKSDIDGNVKMNYGGTVEVDAAFTVGKDVDFNTGNIDITGDLVIQGDIKSGFKVKATGEIDISGTVEDGEIETDGTVLVKRGFIGDGKGVIKAGKDAIVRFVHGQKVFAGNDIYIHEEAVQAELTACGSIIAQDGKGVIIGGTARAGKTLTAKILGNNRYTKTEIVVAEKVGMQERILQLTKDLNGLDAKLNQITDKMMYFMNKNSKSKLSQAEEVEFRSLDKISADITVTQDTLRAELKELEAKLIELRAIANVRVLKTIYPGTVLRIAGLKKEIIEEKGPGDYKVVNGAIEYHSH